MQRRRHRRRPGDVHQVLEACMNTTSSTELALTRSIHSIRCRIVLWCPRAPAGNVTLDTLDRFSHHAPVRRTACHRCDRIVLYLRSGRASPPNG